MLKRSTDSPLQIHSFLSAGVKATAVCCFDLKNYAPAIFNIKNVKHPLQVFRS